MRAAVLGLIALGASAFACPPLSLQAIVPGVWLVPGAQEAPARGNCGRVANSVVLEGAQGLVMVDPGPTYKDGLRVRQLIRAQIGRPVVAVVATHAHPENVLAASVFVKPGVVFFASDITAARMRRYCPRCRRNLRAAIGEDEIRGTRIVLPRQTIQSARATVELAGVTLTVLRFEGGHLPGNIALYDAARGVLLAGGLVNNRQIPQMRDAQLADWAAVLAELADLAPAHVLPGHGPAGDAGLIAAMRGYFEQLERSVGADVQTGNDAASAPQRLAFPDYRDWAEYLPEHGLNVQKRWREAEQELFDR
ncbi:MAG: MBL fold metallo-hydrolase [Rhodocyclaceae bacterium]|nr:MBL fold metallo-hydrolase [Rhodocyclaceae bacterium]